MAVVAALVVDAGGSLLAAGGPPVDDVGKPLDGCDATGPSAGGVVDAAPLPLLPTTASVRSGSLDSPQAGLHNASQNMGTVARLVVMFMIGNLRN
jgi:hypothetical protein